MCSSGLINSFHGDSPSLGWYDFLVHRKIPESHTKSYLEGKFPVICRGRSENSKILGLCLYTEEAQDPETVPFNQDTVCSAVFQLI